MARAESVSAGALRARLRAGRRRHRAGSISEFLSDGYSALLFVAIYGWATAKTIAGYVPPNSANPATLSVRSWLTVAVLVGLAGAFARGLAALGPLFATPAGQSWALATPVSRRGWLWPWLVTLLGLSAVAGAVVGAGAGAFARVSQLNWAITAGAVFGPTIAALGVVAQSPAAPRWVPWQGQGLLASGIAGCGAIVAASAAGNDLPEPTFSLAAVTGASCAMCFGAVVLALRALPRIDRVALTGGAQLASAIGGAVTLLDPALLADVVAVRRWRSVGSVRSRTWWPGARWWILLQAEFRRVTRRPSTVLTWAALALVPYVVALVWPVAVDPLRIFAGYLAVDRLAGGLRYVCRSAALRRALGGGDGELRVAHLVVPSLGLAFWWAATAPVGGWSNPVLTAVLAVGVLAAVYRGAGRRPISYAGMAVDTPFGLLPLDLIRQVLRGPDVLAVVLVVEAVAGG